MNTTEQFRYIIAGALSVPVSEIDDQLSYQGIPEWDSMSHVSLISELESNYRISIEMEDALEMSTVSKVREVLTKYGVEIV